MVSSPSGTFPSAQQTLSSENERNMCNAMNEVIMINALLDKNLSINQARATGWSRPA